MRELRFDEIAAMNGNGSSMRTVLKYFIDKGAAIYLLHEEIGKPTERYFLVKYEELEIPLRAYDLNFYSIYNSLLGREITSKKSNSYSVLSAWNIPTPDTLSYTNMAEAVAFAARHPRIVVKPSNGAHGDGITTGVNSKEALQVAIEQAQTIDPKILLQEQVAGDDYRLLFIDYKFVAAVKRIPASITGDGTHTIRELIETSNDKISQLWADIRNGNVDAVATRGSISKTPIDEVATARGAAFLEQVPAQGESLQLLDKANVSLGGQTHDVTDQVNHELTDKLSALLQKIAVPLCGIDVLSTDISSPPERKASYVIELNAAPGLRLHELPTEGQSRHVCAMVAESLIKYYRNVASR